MDSRATPTNRRKHLAFIIAGATGLLVALWLLSFMVSDKCLDQGGRIGSSWAECEFPGGEIAAWPSLVGAAPIAFTCATWIALWVLCFRFVSAALNRRK